MDPSSRQAYVIVALLLLACHSVTAQDPHDHHHHEVNVVPHCSYKLDFSTTEAALRSFILKGETEKAAAILISKNESFSHGAGFTYDDAQACFLVQSSDRTRDPDIVAIQATAMAAEKTGYIERLVRSTVSSFIRECECPIYTAQEFDQMATNLDRVFGDPAQRKLILEFTGEEHVPEHVHGKRRLLVTESSPVNSFACAHCEPGSACNGNVNWCN